MQSIDEWKLLEPVKVGVMSLRNRIVMPPMETRLSRPDGSVTKAMIDYYAERAKGGVGLLIVENTFVDDKESRSSLISSAVPTRTPHWRWRSMLRATSMLPVGRTQRTFR